MLQRPTTPLSGESQPPLRKSERTALAAALLAAFLISPQTRAAELTGVEPVEGVRVEKGTPLAEVLAKLPKTTTITVSEGDPIPVALSWSLSEFAATARGGNIVAQRYTPQTRGAYEVTGTFALPEGVTRADASLPLHVKASVGVGSGPMFKLDDRELLDQPGKYVTRTMKFGDVERSYHYYLPSTYTGDEPLPVMLTFHGGGSYAISQLVYSRFDFVAEREGFIVVAPDYGSSALGRFTTPGLVEFTSAILDELEQQFKIDTRRVYASGISMGGSASFTLAHELSDRIAAVAPVASSARGVLERKLPRPTTIVWFYGTRDSGYGPQIIQTLEHLVTQNKASRQPAVKLWTPTAEDPTGITRLSYSGGTDGTEVIFYRIDEGGHTWPGKYQYASILSVGLTSQHVDGSQVIWDHLKQHRLPEQTAE